MHFIPLLTISFLVSSISGDRIDDLLAKFPKDYAQKTEMRQLLETIESVLQVTISDFLGKGGYGFILEIRRDEESEPVALKVSSTKDKKCTRLNKMIAISDLNLKYTIKMTGFSVLKMKVFKIKEQGLNDETTMALKQDQLPLAPATEEVSFYYCLMELKRAERSLDRRLPSDFQTEQCPDKSTFFAYITYKLLVAFEEFNFKGNYLHADVKPQNLVLIKDPSSSCKYEPRIIDFDLSFQSNKEKGATHPPYVLYTITHRPPEIIEYCPDNDCKGSTGLKTNQQRFITEYVCDSEYKEDAAALAITLKDILEANDKEEVLSGQLVEYVKNTVIPSIGNSSVKKRSNIKKMRWEMETFLRSANSNWVSPSSEIELVAERRPSIARRVGAGLLGVLRFFGCLGSEEVDDRIRRYIIL